jgi:opacity protein-like surface antigen
MHHQPFRLFTSLLSAAVLLTFSGTASAQGFGIGARIASIRGNAEADTSALRFLGGQIRMHVSPRTAFEVSLDRHREDSGDLTQRVVDYPLQATLMMYPVHSTFSPYLLGGFGWYTHKVQDLTGDKPADIVSTRRTGWHAGIGAEILAGRHVGVHADYRYTFLHFGGSSSDSSSLTGHILPTYQGSMWTAGFTLYF